MCEDQKRRLKMQLLNDAVRLSINPYGVTILSAGVRRLPIDQIMGILERIQTFDDFFDPLGDHDVDAFDHGGLRIVWRISYHNLDFTAPPDDPTAIFESIRILRIQLESEAAPLRGRSSW